MVVTLALQGHLKIARWSLDLLASLVEARQILAYRLSVHGGVFWLTQGSNPVTLDRSARRCRGPVRTLSIAKHPFDPFIGRLFSEKSFLATRGSNPGPLGRGARRCQGPMGALVTPWHPCDPPTGRPHFEKKFFWPRGDRTRGLLAGALDAARNPWGHL